MTDLRKAERTKLRDIRARELEALADMAKAVDDDPAAIPHRAGRGTRVGSS